MSKKPGRLSKGTGSVHKSQQMPLQQKYYVFDDIDNENGKWRIFLRKLSVLFLKIFGFMKILLFFSILTLLPVLF